MQCCFPGIFNGYRKETQSLIEDLQELAVPGHRLRPRPSPRRRETSTSPLRSFGKLFTPAGCQVSVTAGPEKGVMTLWWLKELMLAHLYDTAVERWTVPLWELTSPLVLNQRYSGAAFPQPRACLHQVPQRHREATAALQPLIHDATGSAAGRRRITIASNPGRAICATSVLTD